MRTVILDAYNVIHKLPELERELETDLRKARIKLINMMVNWKWSRGSSFKGKIILVFDGQDNIFATEGSRSHGIDCIFTRSKEEADDRIIGLVQRSQKPEDLVIVSDDNAVRDEASRLGARVEFPDYIRKKKNRRKKEFSRERDKGTLDSKTEKEIDDYYKKALGID